MKWFRCFYALVLAGTFLVGAQPRSTTGTKAVLVVDKASNDMTDLVLFNIFERLKPHEVAKRYGNSKFYIGRIKGSYLKENEEIKVLSGLEVTIYTERQYHPTERPYEAASFKLGKKIRIGSALGRQISNEKGELIIMIE